jgi:hypothetical protein
MGTLAKPQGLALLVKAAKLADLPATQLTNRVETTTITVN